MLQILLQSLRDHLATMNHFHQQNKVWCLMVFDGEANSAQTFWSTGNQNVFAAHAEEWLCMEFPNAYQNYVNQNGNPPVVADIFVRFSPCGEASNHLQPHGCTPKLVSLTFDYQQIQSWNVYFDQIHGNNNVNQVNRTLTAMTEATAATAGNLKFYKL